MFGHCRSEADDRRVTAVAIYTRISSDPLGQSTSTRRQEKNCRAFCDARGWDVAAVYEDVDTSAYMPGVLRPSFQELQADLPSYDGVVAWRLDRLVRRPADFERFWERCERHGVFLASATEPVDSSTELGIAIVRILVTFAQLESHARSQRLRAKAAETAASGRPPTRLPAYGHTDGWNAVEPAEAALIREAADRYLAGEAPEVIAALFNARGEHKRSGASWQGHDLRRLLAAHRMVGDRSHLGIPVARDCWPAILDRDTHHLILAKQEAARGRRRTPMKSLLAGWIICGRCGTRMRGSRAAKQRYTCDRCRSSITGPPTDRWMQHQIVWRSRFAARWHDDRKRLHPPPVTDTIWKTLTRDERRTHIARHLRHLVIGPGSGGGGPWDGTRLRPEWLEPLPDAPPFDSPVYAVHIAALDDPTIVSTPAAAAILGVTRSRASGLAAEGTLRTHARIGKRRVFLRSDVELLAIARSSPDAKPGRDRAGRYVLGHPHSYRPRKTSEVCDAYLDGASIKEISAVLRMSHTSVRRELDAAGIELRAVGDSISLGQQRRRQRGSPW